MGNPMTIFELTVTEETYSDLQLGNHLLTDVTYLEGHPQFLFCLLSNKTPLLLRVKASTPPSPVLSIRCIRNSSDDFAADMLPAARTLAQDVFCALERRGLQMAWLKEPPFGIETR